MKKLLAFTLTIFFLLILTAPPLMAIDLAANPRQLLQNNQNVEELILQDIFRLDTSIQKNISKIQELALQLAIVQQELQEARLHQTQLEAELTINRQGLKRSLRFFHTYGASPFIATAALSSNWSDFFIRWELSKRLAEYFLDNVRQHLGLQALAREKSALAATKEKELKQSQKELLASQQKLASLKQEQEKRLAELRQQNTGWSKELLALEKAWSSALPSLHYLLQQLPALPWQTLRPDDIEVDLAGGKVLATFNQASLNSKLFDSQEKLHGIRLVLPGDGVLIPGPDFELQGTLQVAGPHQLLFIPHSVSFCGIPLERSTWSELLSEDKLKLNLPPPVYGLQFKEISLNPGQMILVLGW